MELCSIKGCPNFGKYCRLHKSLPALKEQKPIAKVAEKRKLLNKEYIKEVIKFLIKNPLCVLKFEGCTKKAVGIHHRKGKATEELLMNKKWWWPSCNHCNLMAEIKDAESRQKDIKLSKFNESPTNH